MTRRLNRESSTMSILYFFFVSKIAFPFSVFSEPLYLCLVGFLLVDLNGVPMCPLQFGKIPSETVQTTHPPPVFWLSPHPRISCSNPGNGVSP